MFTAGLCRCSFESFLEHANADMYEIMIMCSMIFRVTEC